MDSQTLAEVMGGSADYDRYAAPFTEAMQAAGCNTVQRTTSRRAQIGHESAGLRYMEEIASGAEYEGRTDLGNIYAGDGMRFKGSGPIQLTGRNNFRAFTAWTRAQGLTNLDFEANPQLVRDDPKWGFLAASWYWTVARPQINAMCDAGDIEGVTRAINGGTNGLADRQARYQRALNIGQRLLEGGTPAAAPAEKVLDYPRDQVTQETFYNCGPASSQTVIRAATGQLLREVDLAGELGTTTNGTDYIGRFPAVLNKHIPGSAYTYRDMPNDPPTSAQEQQLWDDIVHSIDAGHGVVANIVAPPSNYPRAVAPSTISPAYSGGTVYHYIAIMGYSDNGERRVWVADSGFTPFGYWLAFSQLATLIPPKGYTYSTAEPEDTLTQLDSTRIELALDQLAGPGKNQDGTPTFTGWDYQAVLDAAKTNLTNGQGLTLAQMLCLNIDATRALTDAVRALKETK